jgi:spermidine synthase
LQTTVASPETHPSTPSVTKYLPILLLLFAGSGCAALIYEVAWYQILQLALGSTAVSLGILLATFMGGLCIGSLWLPRLDLRGRHPLNVYAALEFGIAIFGIVVTVAMPFISRVYVVGAEHGMSGMLLRGVVAAVCMLPSTILMGASLPAIVRGIEATPQGVSWWALLYGGNTAGAVFGCLLAGFYLLRVYNMATAAFVAAAINIAVAGVSFLLSRGMAQPSDSAANTPRVVAHTAQGRWPVYISIALSGAAALGAEVVWTRLLGMLLLATVYVFSVILAVFLIGLAIGGAAASWFIRRTRADISLGVCQLLLTLGIAWTAMVITGILPNWSDAILTTTNPWEMFFLDFKRCVFAILPSALLWGASFPLACAAAIKSPDDDSSRVAGGVYAANTLGGIVGALMVSLVLIPWIGTQQSQRVILALVALSGAIVLIPALKGKAAASLGVLASLVVAALIAWQLPATPGELIAYGRFMGTPAYRGSSQVLYVAEGRNSSVAISRWNNGTTYVNVNGHVEATTEPFDMKLQRMVGHLPGIIHPNPKSVLGIGFGAGVSAGTFTRYPGIQKITVCEIEPVIPPASTRYFGEQDYDVLHNPRTHIVYDDARHYLLTTTEKFDIIASDPLDVFVKGTAALYSKEYFEVVKKHLNPGGMFSLYVPLYETDEPTIKSELETFFQAFPNATVWSNTRDGLGYDMVFMGQVEPLKINVDEVQQRLDRPDYGPVRDSLRGIGTPTAIDLFSTYAGQRSDMGQWTRGAAVNSDSDLRLSYLAGWGINSQLEDALYRAMLRYRKRPDDIFTGSARTIQALYSAMMQ